MPNTKTKVTFNGTAEQEAELLAFINKTKDEKGSTMPILQKAQEIYGYLPEEVQVIVAEATGVPLSEIYGIASFYAQFTLNPKGKVQISVCMGTACYVKGAANILDRVVSKIGCPAGSITEDGQYSVDATRCVGACGLAPVMLINEDVYGRLVPEKVDGILEKYK
ncbi:MAG: NAD(P)H-dependent oxidoreductase subunit E [Oscillospiraceae bacterium]|jgi:NADH:ubiquinone oxidoreductase subunit E|nr:NAD(P)H-dependent oxidoreductase subunit E [Oscillospiraceae bacterium]